MYRTNPIKLSSFATSVVSSNWMEKWTLFFNREHNWLLTSSAISESRRATVWCDIGMDSNFFAEEVPTIMRATPNAHGWKKSKKPDLAISCVMINNDLIDDKLRWFVRSCLCISSHRIGPLSIFWSVQVVCLRCLFVLLSNDDAISWDSSNCLRERLYISNTMDNRVYVFV